MNGLFRSSWLNCLLVTAAAAVFSVSSFGAPATKNAGLTFVSAKPQFAKIALTKDGTKVLGIAFDESQGTDTRYDVVYIFNADTIGPITKYIRIDSSSSTKKGVSTCSFEPTVIPVLFDENCMGVEKPWELNFETVHEKIETKEKVNGSTVKNVTEKKEFGIQAILRMESDGRWRYIFTRGFKTADTIERAEVLAFNQKPTISVETMRLDEKDRKVGMSLDLVCGDNEFICERNSGDTYIELEFRDSDGKVVEKDRQRVDSMQYELAQRKIGCAPSG